MTYQVIDKKNHVVISEHETRQAAWTAWQDCWMGKPASYIDRFTLGKATNMKKYLRGNSTHEQGGKKECN